MKLLAVLAIICMTIPTLANAKSCHANSAQGQGNLNCGGQHSQSPQNSQTPTSGLGPAGQTPDPSTTNQHVGMSTLTPAQSLPVVQPIVTPPQSTNIAPKQQGGGTPPQPQAQYVVPPKSATAVPTPTTAKPILAPPQQGTGTPQPMAVPNKQPVAVPNRIPQPVNGLVPAKTPMMTPHPQYVHLPVTKPGLKPQAQPRPQAVIEPPKKTVQIPKPKPLMVPHLATGSVTSGPHVVQIPGKTTPIVSGTQTPTGATHYLLTGNPGGNLGVIKISGAILTNEIVEPGIQNQRVELYRSNDAEEVLYQDVIPMDKTGFHLTVIGTRPPTYK
jgi:hypothetical protein